MISDPVVANHIGSFKRDGYTILPSIFDEATTRTWRRLHDELQEGRSETVWQFSDMCERAPDTMLPAFTHPLVLNILEGIMGPFVQLDTLILEGSQPTN